MMRLSSGWPVPWVAKQTISWEVTFGTLIALRAGEPGSINAPVGTRGPFAVGERRGCRS